MCCSISQGEWASNVDRTPQGGLTVDAGCYLGATISLQFYRSGVVFLQISTGYFLGSGAYAGTSRLGSAIEIRRDGVRARRPGAPLDHSVLGAVWKSLFRFELVNHGPSKAGYLANLRQAKNLQ